jgi:hypothetical protein
MNSTKILEAVPMTTLHITVQSYQFLESRRERHEGKYKVLDGIIERYQILEQENEELRIINADLKDSLIASRSKYDRLVIERSVVSDNTQELHVFNLPLQTSD